MHNTQSQFIAHSQLLVALSRTEVTEVGYRVIAFSGHGKQYISQWTGKYSLYLLQTAVEGFSCGYLFLLESTQKIAGSLLIGLLVGSRNVP